MDRDSTKRFGISSNQIKKESLFRGEVKFLTGGNGWSNPHKSATRLYPAGRLGAIPKPTVKSGMKKRRVFLHVSPWNKCFRGIFIPFLQRQQTFSITNTRLFAGIEKGMLL